MLPGNSKDSPLLNVCVSKVLFNSYIHHANTHALRKAIETKLGMFLRKHVSGLTRTQDANDVWHYTFPPLKECRSKFAQMMKHKIVWEGGEALEWRFCDLRLLL